MIVITKDVILKTEVEVVKDITETEVVIEIETGVMIDIKINHIGIEVVIDIEKRVEKDIIETKVVIDIGIEVLIDIIKINHTEVKVKTDTGTDLKKIEMKKSMLFF